MKVLVANRGEIACRVLRTLRERSIESVSVYSEVDAGNPHVWLADESVCIGEPRAYLDIEKVIEAAKQTSATAIHPGYGFLAENADFVAACEAAGIVFIGPSVAAMHAFADKRAARVLAMKHDVPVIDGAEVCDSPEVAKEMAQKVGYPVLLKASAGGGGKGMRKAFGPDDIADAYESASREGESAFGDGRLLLEKYIHPARHIEIQILGDGKNAMVVGERECSLQRRYQKVLEEAPAIFISEETRKALAESAIRLAEAVGYSGAGTVEFLVGPDGRHYFLEVNTRLQVEHPVSEMISGIDLVAAQIDLAHGGALPKTPMLRGHSIEARLNAEDAYGGYLPQSGDILMLDWPQWPHVRIDSGIVEGGEISPHYDSMIAKVIVWGETREVARTRLLAALKETTLLGVTTNQSFLIDLLEAPFFASGETYTSTVESETWTAPEVPEFVKTAAENAGSAPATGPVGDSKTDRYSPWASIGKFRMGQ
jgi:geranyl-CoA carboxylase alpha subunit